MDEVYKGISQKTLRNKGLVPELQHAVELLNITRKGYPENTVLYEIVKECLSPATTAGLKQVIGNEKILADLSQVLQLSELESGLHVSLEKESEGSTLIQPCTLLDIDSSEALEKAQEVITPKHLKVLNQLLESYMKSVYSKVIRFMFPTGNFQSTSDGMASVVQRMRMLEKDTKEKQLQIVQQEAYNKSLLSMVFKQFGNYALKLESMISKHRFSEYALFHLQFLSVSMKAHLLKLRCLELEVLNRSYTAESVAALKILDAKLDVRIKAAKQSLIEVNHKLSKYEGLDPRFQKLVSEYASLKKDLQFFSMIDKESAHQASV